ncbi:hypothetical protein ACHAXR_006229 [Thalassiosira sp. AJA248-18]
MVAFADDAKATTASEPQSIADMIYSHFDTYQHDHAGISTASSSYSSSAIRAAASLRSDIHSSAIITEEEGENENNVTTEEQTATAIVTCLDSAMAIIANTTKKDCWNESVSAVLELAAAFACGGRSSEDVVARAVIERAVEYSTVERDVIRIEGCKLLGLCVRGLMMEGGGKPAASILKKKNKKGSAKVAVAASSNENGGGGGADLSAWKVECLVTAGKALLPRTTDKIAKVRSAAIAACAFLFSKDAAACTNNDEGYAELSNSLQCNLLWLLANDSSAANRALVASILPTTEENIPSLIERIKDVDVKVREAALDSLRVNVEFGDLTEDWRVEILRMGFTKRYVFICSTTYAKTVELLITSWLKSTKFNPLALLDQLNPVLNESVCELASQVLIRVASTIDCESVKVERGVELVREQFGGPEVRSLQKEVLKRMNVNDKDNTQDGSNADDDNDGEENTTPSLTPSKALFLRVKCNLSTNKSETISEIISDIPTLCILLTTHIDNLIDFNADEDYDQMDEDEAAAYEDYQNFICLQLIHMAKSSELQEEGSRRHFLSIMRRILSRLATPDDLVEMCVKAMAVAHDTESQFVQTISEILVDVEEDDTFRSKELQDERAIVIVRQMRIIAILSIVLESISGAMVGHPILDSFFSHLSPAITSKNAIVREHGVICLSKFCLLSEEQKVRAEFQPLLMTIAGSVEERVEVRAQAALALCDLALIHERMLLDDGGNNDDEGSMPFKDMLLEMLSHSKPGIVIIAAEITAKLLLAGRLHDPALIAWLVLIYFDTTLTATEFDDEDLDGDEVVKEVGSPVRLQQLLSIFFPTYSMSSLDANDDMMACVGPLLSIVNEKLSGSVKSASSGKAMMAQWPVAKMIEYVCYNVDLADKKKNEETESKKAKKNEVETVVDGEQTVGETGEDPVEGGNEAVKEDEIDDSNNIVEDEEEEVEVIEASSTLLASIDIAEFLSEQCDDAPNFYNRALAKILASACIDIESEDKALLRRLKSNVNEAEYANDDGPTVKSIKKLADVLVDVEDHVSDDEVSVSSEESVHNAGDDHEKEEEVAEEEHTLAEKNDSTEKENPRLSMGSVKSVKSSAEGERALPRMSLADVNCN